MKLIQSAAILAGLGLTLFLRRAADASARATIAVAGDAQGLPRIDCILPANCLDFDGEEE